MLIIWFGRRGTGKATSIRASIPTLKKPVVVLDVLGNYTGYASQEGEWLDTHGTTETLEALKSYVAKPDESPSIIVLQTGSISTALDFICSAFWHTGGGTLVLDEGDFFSLSETPCFDEAIRYGRNRGIDMVFGCRRPAEISKNITAGADIVYVFNTSEPRDIDYYRDYLGDNMAFRLATLKPHTGLFKDIQNQSEGEFYAQPSGLIVLKPQKKVLTAPTLQPAVIPEIPDPTSDPDSQLSPEV